jgi:hypothetical protein
MKRQILLFATSLFSIFSFAQSDVKFNVQAGISSAAMSGDAIESLDNIIDYTNGMVTRGAKSGFFGGVSANIPLNEMFSVEPGIIYSQKGAELKGELGLKGMEFLGVNAKARLNSHYVDLPLVLKADINGLQIFAGPQVSYLAKADLRTTAGLLGFNLLNKTFDATEQFNRWDAGITGGVGYRFGNGLNIKASYDHGLSRVDANQNLNAYNRAFKVGLGYTF